MQLWQLIDCSILFHTICFLLVCFAGFSLVDATRRTHPTLITLNASQVVFKVCKSPRPADVCKQVVAKLRQNVPQWFASVVGQGGVLIPLLAPLGL